MSKGNLIQEKNIAGRKRLRNDAGIRKWGCLSQCNQCDQGFKWKNNSNKWLYKEIFIENSNYFEETKCKVDSCNIWCPKCKPNDCLILSKQIKKETNNPPPKKQTKNNPTNCTNQKVADLRRKSSRHRCGRSPAYSTSHGRLPWRWRGLPTGCSLGTLWIIFSFSLRDPVRKMALWERPKPLTSLGSRGLAQQPPDRKDGDPQRPLWDERWHDSNVFMFPRPHSFQI